MSTLTLAPTITRSAGLPSPKGSTLLRKCACGGNKQSDDEKRKSALLQRKGQRPITAAEEEGVPAVVDTALRSARRSSVSCSSIPLSYFDVTGHRGR